MAIDKQDTVFIYKTRTGKEEVINGESWKEKAVTDRISSLDSLVNAGLLVRDEPPFYMGVAGETIRSARVIRGSWQRGMVAQGSEAEYVGVSAEKASKNRTFLFKKSGRVVIETGREVLSEGDRLAPIPGGKGGIFLDSQINIMSSRQADYDLSCDNSVFSTSQPIKVFTTTNDPGVVGKSVTVYLIDSEGQFQIEVLTLNSTNSTRPVSGSYSCSKVVAVFLENVVWSSDFRITNQADDLCVEISGPTGGVYYGRVGHASIVNGHDHRLKVIPSAPITEPIVVYEIYGGDVRYEILNEVDGAGSYTLEGYMGQVYIFAGADNVPDASFDVIVEADTGYPSLGTILEVTNNGIYSVVQANSEAFGGDTSGEGGIPGASATVDYKDSVRAATTGNIPTTSFTGGDVGGVIEGLGSLNDLAIDGITDFSNGERILIKNQTNGYENGIYIIDNVGSPIGGLYRLIRTEDADTSEKVTPGMTVFVEEGSANGERYFYLANETPVVLNTTVLVFSPTAPLIYEEGIGSYSVQRVGVTNTASGAYSGALSGRYNSCNTLYSVIAGGQLNNCTFGAPGFQGRGFIGGGYYNEIGAALGVIGGGYKNWVRTSWQFTGGGVIGGGVYNTVFGNSCILAGGFNIASGDSMGDTYATIVGGYENTNEGDFSFIGGGNYNTLKLFSEYSFIGSGFNNYTYNGSRYSFIGTCNGAKIGVSGGVGYNHSGVVIGYRPEIYGGYNIIGSGYGNEIGDRGKPSPAFQSIIGSGRHNRIWSDYSGIMSGYRNGVYGSYSFIGSGYENLINKSNREYAFIGTGYQNSTDEWGCFVGNGWWNTTDAGGGFIGSGGGNKITNRSYASIVGCGYYNEIGSASYSARYSAIVGGYGNTLARDGDAHFSMAFGYNVSLNGENSFLWGHDSLGISTSLRNTFMIATGNVAFGQVTGFSGGETVLAIKNGTPPSGGVADQAFLYAKDDVGESHLYTMDEGGNETKLGSHNKDGEWEFFSRNVRTGRTVRVNMEKLVRLVERLSGENLLEEIYE